jgi:beta-fructofuranosidase
MNYHPKGMQMWDAWYWQKDGEVHVFHLQRLRPGSQRSELESDSIGHAVSKDLIDWEEKPIVLSPGEPGSLDDMCLFTGCTFENNGKYYMYYTMRCSEDQGRKQRMGLATSGDLYAWKKYENNPVFVPDSKYYCSFDNPAENGIVDCRDMIIVKDPDGDGFYGFYAARVPSDEMPEGAVIACAYSNDLVHWEQRKPVFQPDKYTIIEVPDIFYLDGKWYLLLLCNNEYGNRDLFQEEQLTMGTIYAVADHIEGPYTEPDDNILIGSTSYSGLSCRTLMFEGKRYVMYTSTERNPEVDSGAVNMGVLSTPKELKVVDGKLRAVYSDRIEKKINGILLDKAGYMDTIDCRLLYATSGKWNISEDAITGEIRTAWTRYTFQSRGRSFIYSADITVYHGAGAGLGFKMSEDGYNGCIFMLDYNKKLLQFLGIPNMRVIESRKIDLEYGKSYRVKVVSKDKFLEFYINDILYMQCVHYFSREGHLGLIIDRSKAEFKSIKAVSLDCEVE